MIYVALLLALSSSSASAQSDPALADSFRTLERGTSLELVTTTPLQFNSFHPQGMARIDGLLFMSAVETIDRPQFINDDAIPYDRTAGSGEAHLFKFDEAGQLLDSVRLGEGSLYHPGGIDFDGTHLWISVAEYRPDSHSIIYRIDPETLAAEEVMRFDDHLGAVVHNPDRQTLHGISWGADRTYTWRQTSGSYQPDYFEVISRTGEGVQYQDCQHLQDNFSLCSGLFSFSLDNTHMLTMGAIDMLDLELNRVLHRFTFSDTAGSGELISRNPFLFEVSNSGEMLFSFVPEDEQSNLYRFRVPAAP